jgi:hypothetical protein
MKTTNILGNSPYLLDHIPSFHQVDLNVGFLEQILELYDRPLEIFRCTNGLFWLIDFEISL